MDICFVHRGGPQMASFRYRAEIPAKELAKYGHEVSINHGRGQLVIFSKPMADDLELARSIKGQCHIAVDIADNHFDKGDLYQKMLEIADTVIVPTEVMAGIVSQRTSKAPWIIGDPYEFERQSPHADGDKTVWFGNRVNFPDIKPYMKYVDRVVTDIDQEGITFYSPENLRRALSEANLCILPTRPGAEYKTANRLINAVQMGLFPICDTHPSYDEFKDFVWTGGIHTGMRWARHFHTDLNSLVRKCQSYIEETYSPAVIGKQWADLCDSI